MRAAPDAELPSRAMAGAYAWNISHRDFLLHEPPLFRTGDPKELADEWAALPSGS
ncbi:hypothetical protein AB0J84_07715 [Micromonospora arborensis]|uniref:hypothetical protein n=1 Tax=Micromonospora arborensis TaxID=2116518 RepID=UPI00343AF6B5